MLRLRGEERVQGVHADSAHVDRVTAPAQTFDEEGCNALLVLDQQHHPHRGTPHSAVLTETIRAPDATPAHSPPEALPLPATMPVMFVPCP